MINRLIEDSGIPLLLSLICLYYVFRILVLKDTKSLRPKDAPPLKDEEGYRKAAAAVIMMFFVFSFVMAILLLYNPLIALLEIIFGTLLTFLLWKRIEVKYS